MQTQGAVTWRSWWDGDPAAPGRISEQWGVAMYPTLCVLDHNGVVRYRVVGLEDERALERTLTELLKEAEAAGRAP